MRKISTLLLSLGLFFYLSAQNYHKYLKNRDAPFNYLATQWTDSVLNQMSTEEKIGQLFMVATYSTSDNLENHKQVKQLIKKHHIGGLIFMQGTVHRQIQLLNQFQTLSKIPLLIGMDLETGLGFRLKNTISFPRSMTLGAVSDDNLIYETAREIGRQCRRVGVHVNFAPVLDINNNKGNPVIGTRSFGEDRDNVTEKGRLFMEGLQAEYVLAVGKHFPGHGDTQIDSHLSLPLLDFKNSRLDSLELYPFKALINYGIGGIMTAHLRVPAIDNDHPTSLSKKAITNILKKKMGFHGLIFTDALNMGGVANASGNIDLQALLAGNDVLLFSQNVPKAIEKIKQALLTEELSEKALNTHVRKILLTKQWVGLNNWSVIRENNIAEDLHKSRNLMLQQKLAKAAITLIKNNNNLLPIKKLASKHIAAVSIDANNDNAFLEKLTHYASVDTFTIPEGASQARYDKIADELKKYNTVIIAKHHPKYSLKQNFGATEKSVRFLQKIQTKQNVIFAFMGLPYGAANYDFSKCNAVLIGYEDGNNFREAMAEAIFGGFSINGKLSTSINSYYTENWGLSTKKMRLGYTLPEAERVSSDTLLLIDSIINDAIEQKAMPGAQILIAKNGNIIYNKAYGHHTYQKKQLVKTSDLYDLASLTKVSATLPLLMQHYDKDLLSLATKLSEMLPYFENTDKASLTLEKLLTHETGFPSWIPLYRLLIDTTSYTGTLVANRKNNTYSIQIDKDAWLNRSFKYKKNTFNEEGKVPVGKNLYLTRSVREVLFDTIKKIELPEASPPKYRYSDLGFILCGEYLKKGYDLEETLVKFYKNLGAKTTGMNPWKKYPLNRLVPTSRETFLRKELLQGYVHDPNAALLGGVAGHAGLFSCAEDLAKVWQMYLQKGNYGGEQYIESSTLELFTKQAHPKISRRGIGFDKPDADTTQITSFAQEVPLSSFGHTGFTGTMAWADPENKMVVIILTNRIFPYDWNNKMGEIDLRTKVQKVLYNAIKQTKPLFTPLQTNLQSLQSPVYQKNNLFL